MTHDDSIETLLDAIHSRGVAREPCDFLVEGRTAVGAIGLEGGQVIHARYGDLEGPAAVQRLLDDGPLHHQLIRDPPRRAGNMRVDYQSFLLEALQRLEASGTADAGHLASDLHWDDVMPRTDERPLPVPPGPAGVSAPAPTPPRPAASPPAPPVAEPASTGGTAGRRRPGVDHGGMLVLAGVGALVLAAVVAFALLGRRQDPSPVPAPTGGAVSPPTDPAIGALEASALDGQGADLPALAAGEPPISPAPDLGLAPTIVCRLLVDTRGQVVRAEVFQRRADLEPFELAALQAVRTFRFAPARRSGLPVAVWINWPVQFR